MGQRESNRVGDVEKEEERGMMTGLVLKRGRVRKGIRADGPPLVVGHMQLSSGSLSFYEAS